jgi:hypothetical protein
MTGRAALIRSSVTDLSTVNRKQMSATSEGAT